MGKSLYIKFLHFNSYIESSQDFIGDSSQDPVRFIFQHSISDLSRKCFNNLSRNSFRDFSRIILEISSRSLCWMGWILSDVLSEIYPGIPSVIPPGISLGILSGIPSGILPRTIPNIVTVFLLRFIQDSSQRLFRDLSWDIFRYSLRDFARFFSCTFFRVCNRIPSEFLS